MKTEGRRESENIEDRRGQSAGRRIPGGRITAGGGLGLLVVIVLSLVFGIDPRQLIDPSALDNAGTGEQQASGPYQETPEEAKRRELIAVVLAETLAECGGDASTAFPLYVSRREHRAARVAQVSERYGKRYHLSGAMRLARNLVLRSQPGGRLLGGLDWLYGEAGRASGTRY